MNIGALALMPSRRSWITWPISCTNSSTTKPTANVQPQNRRVGGDRHERRAGGRQQLELRQQQQRALDRGEELGDQRDDRRERAADALAQVARARAAAARGSPNGSLAPARRAGGGAWRGRQRAGRCGWQRRRSRLSMHSIVAAADKRSPNDCIARVAAPMRASPSERSAVAFFSESAG